jgi:hypothetical protein
MKNHRSVAGGLLLSMAATLTACGGSSDPTAPVTHPSSVSSVLTSGTWVVSSLMQRTEDRTSQLSGYSFTFTGAGSENGTVVATKSGSSVNGTWGHSPAVTYYGSTSTESLVLNFGTESPFDRLTKTWNVVSNTSTTLTLGSPEVLEDEHLVFTRQ